MPYKESKKIKIMIYKENNTNKLYVAYTMGKMMINNDWVESVNFKEIFSGNEDDVLTMPRTEFITKFTKVDYTTAQRYSDFTHVSINGTFHWIPSHLYGKTVEIS